MVHFKFSILNSHADMFSLILFFLFKLCFVKIFQNHLKVEINSKIHDNKVCKHALT